MLSVVHSALLTRLFSLYCTVLYCTVLYCTKLYSAVLYCPVLLLCDVLYRTVGSIFDEQ